ncbi:conjugal transfer mating pair stabilization protein TraN [Pseudovibrio sp. Ad37]|uniref:conjugal transfer mating pair stabilization protein TraN n=1 Tax=Pseudovibrio sp. Ad37 TaxID=989422 RepID=UPI0007B21570|nr:conjugal transfer mating pair stabilization protein TraN [Pseudovibrio sp. Ad37]KZL22680.1 conjugal transfer mating pair stabilization protein TraN [Pseudovibrio sp. Ad37]
MTLLKIASRSTSIGVSIAYLLAMQPALADTIGEIGRSGQSFGTEIGQQYNQSQPSISGDTITFSGEDGGSLDIQDLYPGTSSENTRPSSYYFPDMEGTSVDNLRGAYDRNSRMSEAGDGALSGLEADVAGGVTTLGGAAYEIIMQAAKRDRIDWGEDPVLSTTEDIFGVTDVTDGFDDCSIDRAVRETRLNAHVPDNYTCDRIIDETGSADALHDYSGAVVSHYSGPYNMDSCGVDCVKVWIGRVGDNYWKGNCKIYEASTQVEVLNPDAITSVKLTYAKWDDYIQVLAGPPEQEELVWQGNKNFPPETSGKCELAKSWVKNDINKDITSQFKDVEPGDVVSFKIRVSVSGAGEGFGRLQIRYDPTKVITGDHWTPPAALKKAQSIMDGFAEGTFTCTNDPSDEFGCALVDGYKICEDQMGPSPFPGISPLCRAVRIEAETDFYKGQLGCYTDVNGNEQCPMNEGENTNSCSQYAENPGCGFVRSTCVEGATGESGRCYLYEDTYDCGYTSEVPSFAIDEELNCSGPIRCMGDDCLDLEGEQSEDFAKVAALLDAVKFLTQDMTCTGLDGNDVPTGEEDVSCKVFAGEKGSCKVAVGGVQDCCEKPQDVSLTDYMNLLVTVPKLEAGASMLAGNLGFEGAYTALKTGIVDGFTQITQPFSGMVENLSGIVDTITQPIADLAAQISQQFATTATEVAAESMGTLAVEGGEALAGETAGNLTQQLLGETGAQLLSTVMWVYSVYSVTMLLIKIIWACEEDELKLNVKRQLKSCTSLGSYCKTEVLGQCIEKRKSYCCFNSPLSRIIQEQARPQLGESFGSAKNPQCGGLTIEQVGELDWDQMDLSEWIGILDQTGNWPSAEDMTIDNLTGFGSDLNTDGTRKDVITRTTDRLDEIDVDAYRDNAYEDLSP